MKALALLAGLALIASCGRSAPPEEQVPVDSAAVAPVTDSMATAPGVTGSPAADTVMARDTARSM